MGSDFRSSFWVSQDGQKESSLLCVGIERKWCSVAQRTQLGSGS